MNRQFSLVIFFLLIGFLSITNSQHIISGTILNAKDSSVISNAEVYLSDLNKLKYSNENGEYTFANTPTGNYDIIIYSFSHNTITENFEINSDTTFNFYLDPLQDNLSEVVIQARRKELFALRKLRDVEETSIYSGKKTEVILLDLIQGNLASNNSRQIYAQIAGLNIYEGNEGGLQLAIGGRGLDPNRTSNFNTRQNGYDISADVLGYPESYYTPPAEALEEIQVIRGAASLQYGTQFGGLLNFKTKSHKYETKPFGLNSRQTYGSYNFFNSFNSATGKINKLSYYTFYNYKRGDGYRENSSYTSHTAFASLHYQATEKTSISSEFTYFNYLAKQAGGLTESMFELNPQLSNRNRNWFNVDWKLFNVKILHSVSDDTRISLQLFGLDAERNAVGFRGNPINLNENPITALDERNAIGEYILPRDVIKGNFNNWGLELKLLSRYKIKRKNIIYNVGAKLYTANNLSFQGPGSLQSNADFTIYTDEFSNYANQSDFKFPNQNLAFFSEHIIPISEKLKITPGFRYEFIKTESQGIYNQINFDNAGNAIKNEELNDDRILNRNFALLGIGLSYRPSDKLEVYSNISENYRSVTFSDIRVNSPTFIVDPNISDEKGFSSDIGLRGRVNKSFSFDISSYILSYKDRIGIILDERANRIRKNVGDARILGLESLIDINIKQLALKEKEKLKLNVFVNSAYTYSEYTQSEETNVIGKRVEFVPIINLKTGLNFGYNNLFINGQFTYLSEQFTDVQNSASAAAGDNRAGIIGQIPAYQVFDLSFKWAKKKYTIESGVNNVLNRSYYTRRATGYPGPGIIPSDGRTFYFTLGITL